MRIRKNLIRCMLGVFMSIMFVMQAFASDGFIFENSDTVAIEKNEVVNLPAKALRLAINEIYARHGRKFAAEDLTTYFSQQSWYKAKYTASEFDEEKILNKIEKANIKLLSEQKETAEANEALELIKKKYGTRGYIIPGSDTKELSKADLTGLTAQEIRYGLNEIYARHGRAFKADDLVKYFEKKEWYRPTYTPDEFSKVENELISETERKNIKFLSDIQCDSELESIVDLTVSTSWTDQYTKTESSKKEKETKVPETTKAAETEKIPETTKAQESIKVPETTKAAETNKIPETTKAQATEQKQGSNTSTSKNQKNPYLFATKAELISFVTQDTGFGSIYTWQYPTQFKKEREKAFELLKKIDEEAAKIQSISLVDSSITVPVKIDGKSYLKTLEYTNEYYVGEIKDNRPNGFGAILYNGTMVPKFIGYFKKGKPDGYGMLMSSDGSILWESEEPIFNGKQYTADGKTIIYYNKVSKDSTGYDGYATSSNRRLFYGAFIDHLQEINLAQLNPNFIKEVGVLTGEEDHLASFLAENRLIMRPVVEYEGKMDDGKRTKSAKKYYDMFQDNDDLISKYYPQDGVYGNIWYDGEYKKDKITGKGKMYYYSGSLYYDGELKEAKPNGKGTLYNEDGTVKHKGKFKNGDIAG